MSRVGESVRQACIDDIAQSYAVETEECPKMRATDAHRHKNGRRSNPSPVFSAAIRSTCMVSFKSSLRLSNQRRVSRDCISTISDRKRSSREFAVSRQSRATEIALLRYSISLVHLKAWWRSPPKALRPL